MRFAVVVVVVAQKIVVKKACRRGYARALRRNSMIKGRETAASKELHRQGQHTDPWQSESYS